MSGRDDAAVLIFATRYRGPHTARHTYATRMRRAGVRALHLAVEEV